MRADHSITIGPLTTTPAHGTPVGVSTTPMQTPPAPPLSPEPNPTPPASSSARRRALSFGTSPEVLFRGSTISNVNHELGNVLRERRRRRRLSMDGDKKAIEEALAAIEKHDARQRADRDAAVNSSAPVNSSVSEPSTCGEEEEEIENKAPDGRDTNSASAASIVEGAAVRRSSLSSTRSLPGSWRPTERLEEGNETKQGGSSPGSRLMTTSALKGWRSKLSKLSIQALRKASPRK